MFLRRYVLLSSLVCVFPAQPAFAASIVSRQADETSGHAVADSRWVPQDLATNGSRLNLAGDTLVTSVTPVREHQGNTYLGTTVG